MAGAAAAGGCSGAGEAAGVEEDDVEGGRPKPNAGGLGAAAVVEASAEAKNAGGLLLPPLLLLWSALPLASDVAGGGPAGVVDSAAPNERPEDAVLVGVAAGGKIEPSPNVNALAPFFVGAGLAGAGAAKKSSGPTVFFSAAAPSGAAFADSSFELTPPALS